MPEPITTIEVTVARVITEDGQLAVRPLSISGCGHGSIWVLLNDDGTVTPTTEPGRTN